MSIPLPALGIKPPEQISPLDQVGKVLQLRNAQQQGQSNALDLQQKQRAMQDQQTIMETAARYKGDLSAALPELAGKISAASYIPLRKSLIETQKDYAELDEKTLANEKVRADQLLGLITQAKQLPPDQYTQMWPELASRAAAIDPRLKNHVDPNQPMPQQSLDNMAIGLATHSQLASIEQEKRAQTKAQQETQTFNAELPGKQAESKMKVEEAAIPLPERKNMKATEASLALSAAQGDPDAEKALKRLDQSRREGRPVTNIMTGNDAKDIADAIENGDQPPTLQGLYRNAGPVRAELARRGTPLAMMELDWKAVQKHIQTMNGPQQLRLQQSITSAGEMLDKIDGLYSEWQQLAPTSGFKVLNKASLIAMKNLPGRAGAVATALDAQIADLTADLGNVYMGGNSPTDHALGLAGKNLSADWNKDTFEEGIKQARANLKIRANSIKNSGAAGLSGETNYAPPTTPAAPAAGGGFDWTKMPEHK